MATRFTMPKGSLAVEKRVAFRSIDNAALYGAKCDDSGFPVIIVDEKSGLHLVARLSPAFCQYWRSELELCASMTRRESTESGHVA